MSRPAFLCADVNSHATGMWRHPKDKVGWHFARPAREGRSGVGFLSARSYEGDDGATRWQPLIEFAPGAKQAREQFQREAIAAIHIFTEQDRGSAS